MSFAHDNNGSSFRIGYGYDIHRIEPVPPRGQGRPFLLGGILVDEGSGPVAKTDGDILFHAVTDGILGALALPPMGQLFTHDDPRKGSVDSAIYLTEACRQIADRGWKVGNIDVSIILETPRIQNRIPEIRQALARTLGTELFQLSVKVKTHEGIGELGAGAAVEVHASVLLAKTPSNP